MIDGILGAYLTTKAVYDLGRGVYSFFSVRGFAFSAWLGDEICILLVYISALRSLAACVENLS